MLKSIKFFFIEKINKIRNKKNKYRFIVFVRKLDDVSDEKTIMEAAEISSYSERMAYREVIDKMVRKYGEDYGFDIRKS